MAQLIIGDRAGAQGKLAVGCSASVFHPDSNGMLLVQRTDNRLWAVPGGYMESGESVSEGCLREVKEETGLEISILGLVAVYSDPNRLLIYPDGNKWQLVVLHFWGIPAGGHLTPSDETTHFRWVQPSDIPTLPMGDLDRQRILDAFARHPTPILR